MIQAKYTFVAATSLLILSTGCKELKFNGTMQSDSGFSVQQEVDTVKCNERFDWWNCNTETNIQIPRGSTSAQVTLTKSGKQNEIIIEFKEGRNNKKVEIFVDERVSVGDNFDLKGSQIKQNFDIKGNIQTEINRTAEQEGYESCTYTVYERVCRWVPQQVSNIIANEKMMEPGHGGGPGHGGPGMPGMPPHQPGGGGHQECHQEAVTRYGQHFVRFYFETTDKDLLADFTRSGDHLARYTGHYSNTEKIYTYQDVCR